MPYERPLRFRNGQWVRFEIPDGPLNVVLIEAKSAEPFQITDKIDIETIKQRTRKSACGRFVGIYQHAADTLVPGGERPVNDADGNPVIDPETKKQKVEKIEPHHVFMPATIVPQRAVIGVLGEENVTFTHAGERNVALDVSLLKNVAALEDRSDIPAHREATLYKEWDPKDPRSLNKAKLLAK